MAVADIIRENDRDVPRFSLAVVKVASRCNLNCSYCYMYNMGDKSYLEQPPIMSQSTINAIVKRTAEHCAVRGLSSFRFAFHGGEPLLAGIPVLRYFVESARNTFQRNVNLSFVVQTNGTLLTERWCEFFKEFDIALGISLDGPEQTNDRYRLDHFGKGSHSQILSGWNLALSRGIRPGLLAVINLALEPNDFYKYINELGPRMVDVLLPDTTHDRKQPLLECSSITPYGDWLQELFNLWAHAESPLQIRLFEGIIQNILGFKNNLAGMGPTENGALTIETDGAIEAVDFLRICQAGITRTKFNVESHTLDNAFANELIKANYWSGLELSSVCRKCLIKGTCAGGNFAHRFSTKNRFDNPSVYCRDLMKIITHIQNWVVDNLDEDMTTKVGLKKMTYDHAKASLH